MGKWQLLGVRRVPGVNLHGNAGCLGVVRQEQEQEQARARAPEQENEQAQGQEPGTEAGSAIIEFIFLVVLLLVPLIYLVIGAAALQSATYAAVGAADHGAKVFVTAESEAQAGARVADAVRRAASNMGIDGSRATFSYSCNGACLSPGSTVTVNVSIDTVLPLMPREWAVRTGVISSSTTHRVDRYG